MAQKSRVCSCGRIVPINNICPCKKKAYNEAKRKYYGENKDIIKPLKTSRWRKLRSLIIKRDNGCCQRCLIKYGIVNTKDLEVHHIKPRSEYPELMFEESNLITLCKTCNLQLGTNGLDFEPKTNLKNIDFDFKL